MLRLLGTAALLGALAAGAGAQQFYATNNLANFHQGTVGDTLIIFDFQTAAFVDVGDTGRLGLGGLDWSGGPGVGQLIAADSFGPTAGAIYSLSTVDGSSTFIGMAPTPMHDLAWNPSDGKMYGTDSSGRLWRDDTGDSVPETLVGAYNVTTLEVGLGFDGSGNIFVHDLLSDTIYKGAGANPASLAPWVVLPFDSNFSQGLYVGGNKGYHGAFNATAFSQQNWSFDTAGAPNYTFESAFAINPGNGLPFVEVGDLTVIPEPAALLLIGLGAIAALRRR